MHPSAQPGEPALRATARPLSLPGLALAAQPPPTSFFIPLPLAFTLSPHFFLLCPLGCSVCPPPTWDPTTAHGAWILSCSGHLSGVTADAIWPQGEWKGRAVWGRGGGSLIAKAKSHGGVAWVAGGAQASEPVKSCPPRGQAPAEEPGEPSHFPTWKTEAQCPGHQLLVRGGVGWGVKMPIFHGNRTQC